MKSSILSLAILFILLLITACGGPGPRLTSEMKMFAATGSPYVDPDTMTRDEIIHLPTGVRLDQQELFFLLAQKRVVFVGEGHDNIYDHQVELEVIKHLFQLTSGHLAVGFEMLSQPNQEKVDLWLAGKLGDDDFIRLFADDWGVADFVYYREIFNYLKEHKIPLRALNVSRREKRKFMRGLMAEDKKPEAEKHKLTGESANPYQDEALRAMFKGHAQGHGDVAMFIAVQKLWEDTMVSNIKTYLESPAGSDKKMVVIAGGFHIARGYGLPRRLFQQVRFDYCTLLTQTPKALVENERQTMAVDFPEMPLYLCDYLWCVPYRNLKDRQARLGVGMREREHKLEIVMVEEGSAAAKSGLKTGDFIIACNGKKLKEPMDLSILLLEKVKGDKIKLRIERDSEIKVMEVLL